MTNRTDNFNRADGALGTPSDGDSVHPWVAVSGTWGISTNRAAASTAGNIVATLESSVADVDVQVTLQTLGTEGGLAIRVADDSNYLMIRDVRLSGAVDMFDKIAGTFTLKGSGGSGAANGDVLKFSASGSTLNAYKNGTLVVGPINDSAGSTNTQHGLFEQDGAGTRCDFDDFSITSNASSSFNPGWAYGATKTIGGVF